MIEEKVERGKRKRHRGDEDRNTNTAMERHGWRGSKRQLMREDLRESERGLV